MVGLVGYIDIINDDSIEESKVNTTHISLGSELLGQSLGHLFANSSLHHRYVYHDDYCEI